MLETKDYGKDIIELEKKISKNSNDTKAHYKLGVIYDDIEAKQHNEQKAKEHFLLAAEGNPPIANAFIKLAQIEKNSNKSRIIIENALKSFPNNLNIIDRYLWILPLEERLNFIDNLSSTLQQEKIIIQFRIRTLLGLNKYDECISCIDGINTSEKIEKIIYFFIKALCFYYKKDYEQTAKLIYESQRLDIRNEIEPLPTLLKIALLIDTKSELKKILETLNEISVDDSIDYFNIWSLGSFHHDFEKEFNELIDIIIKSTDNEIIHAKIKGLRGLSNANYYSDTYTEKIYEDLNVANDYYSHNSKFAYILASICAKKSNISEALIHIEKYLQNRLIDKDDIDIEGIAYYLFATETEREFYKNYQILKTRILTAKEDLKNQLIEFCGEIVIQQLWKYKNYKEITQLINGTHVSLLQKIEQVFEVAYSYSEMDNSPKAQELYEYLLEKGQGHSSVFNNLGVIKENNGLLSQAKSLYTKALKLNPKSEVEKNNLQRIKKLIAETKAKNETEFIENRIDSAINNLNIAYFKSIDCNSKLIWRLKRIVSKSIASILERDIIENAINMANGNYKSALILSGSIVEAILYDVLISNNISRYQFTKNGRTNSIRVEKMGLNELLFVCNDLKLISDTTFHGSHLLRAYRNLIHPAVEERKSLKISEGTASSAWWIMINVIDDIYEKKFN